MPPKLDRLLRTLIAVAAALSVAMAPMLVRAHQTAVHHVRCVEHGELIELADAGPAAHQSHHDPVAVPGHLDRHDQHCTIDHGLASASAVTGHALAAQGPALAEAVLLLTAAPRGPPALSYAPKTSPPSCA